MKKKTALVLAAIMLMSLLAACGSTASSEPAPAAVDMQSLYDTLLATEGMQEMLSLPADKQLDMLGLEAGDCKQAMIAVCMTNLNADELWLIEATDADALARIQALADTRVQQKLSELENYLPEQFEIVKKAKVITAGNYFALLISPQVDALADTVNGAFGVK